MGKSYKKYPVYGNCDGSEKMDKRHANRRSRKNIKQQLRSKVFEEQDYEISADDFDEKKFSNPCYFKKDGKNKHLLNGLSKWDYENKDVDDYYDEDDYYDDLCDLACRK